MSTTGSTVRCRPLGAGTTQMVGEVVDERMVATIAGARILLRVRVDGRHFWVDAADVDDRGLGE
ncbi:hypothetical protein [Halopenitus malekzadehii]|nr:hypothetical protein [Halopenitus malekzadehii]